MLKIIFVFILLSFSHEQSKVYFMKHIKPENVKRIFQELKISLGKKIGLKVHSGEFNGTYYIRPEMLQELYDYTNGTFIECNTYYNGNRNTTTRHENYIGQYTNWTKNNRKFVIMDDSSKDDFDLKVKNPLILNETKVGGKLKDFDSCIVLSRFKGHSSVGYGGALKQLSLGFASKKGKELIHTAGNNKNWKGMGDHLESSEDLTNAMVDAASSIIDYFRNQSGIVYINFMSNVSMKCDCYSDKENKLNLSDYGILASLDPVALDRACIDIIKNTSANGKYEWLNQLKELDGEHILTIAEKQNLGTQKYELITLSDADTGTLLAVVFSTIGGVSFFVGLFVGIIMRKPKQKTQEDFHLTQKMNE